MHVFSGYGFTPAGNAAVFVPELDAHPANKTAAAKKLANLIMSKR